MIHEKEGAYYGRYQSLNQSKEGCRAKSTLFVDMTWLQLGLLISSAEPGFQ